MIKILIKEDIIVKKEPPRRNKSVKGGEIFEGKSSQNIKNRERRRNLRDDHLPGVKKRKKGGQIPDKLNPIKWTQQKTIWDAFGNPVPHREHNGFQKMDGKRMKFG